MNETMEQRVEALERLVITQQAMLVKLHEATEGHQHCITAFAQILGIELEPLPALPSPPAN